MKPQMLTIDAEESLAQDLCIFLNDPAQSALTGPKFYKEIRQVMLTKGILKRRKLAERFFMKWTNNRVVIAGVPRMVSGRLVLGELKFSSLAESLALAVVGLTGPRPQVHVAVRRGAFALLKKGEK